MYISVYIYICIRIRICVYIYVYVYVDVDVPVYACTSVYIYAYVYLHMYVYMYIYMYMHTYMYIYMYMCIYKDASFLYLPFHSTTLLCSSRYMYASMSLLACIDMHVCMHTSHSTILAVTVSRRFFASTSTLSMIVLLVAISWRERGVRERAKRERVGRGWQERDRYGVGKSEESEGEGGKKTKLFCMRVLDCICKKFCRLSQV